MICGDEEDSKEV
jgi:hypothetical protein